MGHKTTIHDLLGEIESFVPVNKNLLAKAEGLKLKKEDQILFKETLQHWSKGHYDESPEQVVFILENIVSKY